MLASLTRNRFGSPKRKLVFAGIGILAAFLIMFDWLRSSSPWPPSDALLTDAAACKIDGSPMTNAATEQSPIEIECEAPFSIEGEVSQWDLPFAQSTAYRPGEQRREERQPLFFVAFRQKGWLKNLAAGSFSYDGKSGLAVSDEGQTLQFTHQLSAPAKPGTYRVQLHVVERNPILLAQMDPHEAGRPLGILAEALVVVK